MLEPWAIGERGQWLRPRQVSGAERARAARVERELEALRAKYQRAEAAVQRAAHLAEARLGLLEERARALRVAETLAEPDPPIEPETWQSGDHGVAGLARPVTCNRQLTELLAFSPVAILDAWRFEGLGAPMPHATERLTREQTRRHAK